MGEYSDLFEERKPPNPALAVQLTADAVPQQEARYKELAKRYKVPVDVVREFPKDYETKAKADYVNEVTASQPHLRSWLADTKNTAVVETADVGTLSSIGNIFAGRTLKGTAQDVGITAAKGVVGVPQAAVGLLDIFTGGHAGKALEDVGINLKDAQTILSLYYSQAQQNANRAVSDAKGFTGTLSTALQHPSTILTAVGESIPAMLAGGAVGRVITAVAPKVAPWLAAALGEGTVGAGSMAENLRADSPDRLLGIKQTFASVMAGAGTAVFGAASGKFAQSKLGQRLGLADIDTALVTGGMPAAAAATTKTGFVKSLAANGVSEGLFEELPQSMQEQMWQNFAKDKPLGEGVLEAGAMGLLAGATGGVGFQVLSRAATKGLEAAAEEQIQQQRAEQGVEHINNLMALAAQSKLRENSPQTFAEVTQEMADNTEGAPTEVRFDARTLGEVLNQEELALLPSVASQLEEALALGNGEVTVPIGELMANIAGTPLEQKLIEHARVGDNELSAFEMKEAVAQSNEYMQSEAQRVIAEASDSVAAQDSHDKVKQQIFDQLNTVGRFTKDVNEANATVAASMFTALASRIPGMTAEKLFEQFNLKTNGVNPVTGDVLNTVDQWAQQSTQRTALKEGQTHVEIDGVQRHALNSNGKPISQTEEGVKNFYKWFGGSKVVDAEGRPLVVYHSTLDGNFQQFKTTGNFMGHTGVSGISVTDNADMASRYLDRYAELGWVDGVPNQPFKKNVMPLYVRAENPLYQNEPIKTNISMGAPLPKGYVNPLMVKGYDALIRDDAISRKGGVKHSDAKNAIKGREIVVFDPTQIKSATGNNGNYDPTDANILHQTQTSGFKKWSHGNKIISMGDTHEFVTGEGVVVEALHGTTGDFDTFDASKANIESDLGGGFYFTNNPDDVSSNYAGEGPDLTSKIQLLAERIAGDTDRDYSDPDVIAEAKQQLSVTNGGMAMPVFVRFDNPVVLGGSRETFLDYSESYDEETDEYGEPEGKLVEFATALRDVASEYFGADADGALSSVWEHASDYDGVEASKLIELLSSSEGLAYTTDDNGTLASKEIIRRAFEQIGFDGFIDQTANQKFGSERKQGQQMAGMDEGTVHFIAFENTQIKSRLGNNGNYDPTDASILHQSENAAPASLADFTPDTIKDVLGKRDWAIITAENPMAKELSPEENAARNLQLEADLAERGLKFEKAVGRYSSLENSYVVFGIKESEAVALAHYYEQDSVLTNRGLLYGDGRITPATGIEVHASTPEDFFTYIPSTGARFTVALDFDSTGADTGRRAGLGDNGRSFTGFFSNISGGLTGKPNGRDHISVFDVSGAKEFASEYKKSLGAFDDHIAASIPGFREVQVTVGDAIVKSYPKGANVLDIGASEANFGRAISQVSGVIHTTSLDPNFVMADFFAKHNTSPNAEYITEAFGLKEDEGKVAWTEDASLVDRDGFTRPNPNAGKEVKFFTPTKKFDVVHEAMVFQFISGDRETQVARAKELMSPTGVLILEEKFVAGEGLTPETFRANEAKKDSYKEQFFTKGQIAAKAKAVGVAEKDERAVVGMNDLMASPGKLEGVLSANFANVAQFWDSGNFKGYIASDDSAALATLLGNMQPTTSVFSTVATPRTVKNTQPNKYQKAVLGGRSISELSVEEKAQYDAMASVPVLNSSNARGTFNPSTLTISLLEGADLSTFHHEMSHFYLEMLSSIASQENAPEAVVSDMNTLLKWFKVKDLDTWNGMSLAQKRASHEKFAEHYEHYLLEGKAPSVALQPLFRRFSSWMRSVYKSLSNFMASHNTELTPEVRAVYDTMLATDAQIAEAQRARKFMPLFKSAEEIGMAPRDWAQYQNQLQDSTDEAVERLNKRSLRNLKWAVSARNKAIKEVTKDVEQKRKAVEAEVRAEVEAMPVYAAKAALDKLDHKPTDADLQLVSEWFSYSSPDEMLREMAEAQPIKHVIEGMTDQRLLERYGDMTTPQGIEDAANEAVHNEARARAVAIELKALQEGMRTKPADSGGTILEKLRECLAT